MFHNTFLAVPGILFIIGYVPYAVETVRGKAKPSKASWLIWAGMDAITLAGMYAEHTVNPLIIGALCGSALMAALSFVYGASGWNTTDKVCLGGAALSIFLWLVFQDPLYGLMTSLMVNFIGAVPTFVSAWSRPSREVKSTWALFWIASLVGVLEIPQWTLAAAAQPVSFLMIQTTMVYLLFVRRPSKK